MITDVKRLSGLQKVAILFTILGEGLSITLLKELSKTDIRKVRSVARDLDSVSSVSYTHLTLPTILRV